MERNAVEAPRWAQRAFERAITDLNHNGFRSLDPASYSPFRTSSKTYYFSSSDPNSPDICVKLERADANNLFPRKFIVRVRVLKTVQ